MKINEIILKENLDENALTNWVRNTASSAYNTLNPSVGTQISNNQVQASLDNSKAARIKAKQAINITKMKGKVALMNASSEVQEAAKKLRDLNIEKIKSMMPSFKMLLFLIGESLYNSWEDYQLYIAVLKTKLDHKHITQQEYNSEAIAEKNAFITEFIMEFSGAIFVNFILAFITGYLTLITGGTGIIIGALAWIGRFFANAYLVTKANALLATQEGHEFVKSVANFFIEPGHDILSDIVDKIFEIFKKLGVPDFVLNTLKGESTTTTKLPPPSDTTDTTPPNATTGSTPPTSPVNGGNNSNTTTPKNSNQTSQTDYNNAQKLYPGLNPTGGDIRIWENQKRINDFITLKKLGAVIKTDGIWGPKSQEAFNRIINYNENKQSQQNPNDSGDLNDTSYNRGSGINPSVPKNY